MIKPNPEKTAGSVSHSNHRLEHLFDAELQYKSGMDIVVPIDNREGDLIGSGEGTVTGEKIHGSIRWSFFAENCAYLLVKAGIEPQPGQHLCKTNPGGVIATEDGAQIRFDAKGYGLRGHDALKPISRWLCNSAPKTSVINGSIRALESGKAGLTKRPGALAIGLMFRSSSNF